MKRGIKATIASASALTLAAFVPIGTAMAQEGDAVITNTETVNVSLDPSGNVDVARVYDQIAVQGSGTVDYANPVSTVGLRNLDSFGGFTVEGDSIVEETDVDGQLRRRAVSDFDLELPVTVSVMYRLDGQETSPADLVGKSGEVDVTYTIENMTGSEEQISITDGQGNEVTKTAMIYDPFAGSMSFTLPPNYTDVVSDSGFLPAGDGRGGTLMNLSVTLVPGLTDQVLEANFTAQVEDAVIPPVSLSFLPLVVRENTSTRPQLEALQGGAETGQELASNAVLLDENVLALADGAATLVNGILLLNAGAGELSDGLVNDAAPGATLLSDGLQELQSQVPTLTSGVAQLDDGGNQLEDGLQQLQGQVPTLADGVQQLDDGANDLEAGLATLQGNVPALNDGIDQLVAGAKRLEGGILQLQAELAGPPSLQQGVDALLAGAKRVSGGLNDLEAALDAQFGPGLNQLATELGAAAGPGGLADQVVGGIGLIKASRDPVPPPGTGTTPSCGPTCQGTADIVTSQVNTSLRQQVQDAADGAADLDTAYTNLIRPGIKEISDGVDRTDPADPGLVAGLTALQALVPKLVGGVDELAAGATELRKGLEKLQANAGPLGAGVDQLAAGATQLSDGLSELNANVGPLGSGVDQLTAGAVQLSDGLGELNASVGPLGDGVDQLTDGAGQLADGLGDAAAGSVQLSDGLGDAAEAAPALPEGAQRLSAEGTKLLVEAGDDTALSFGERVAVLQASAERTVDGGLPFGAPQDAIVAAAYRYDLAGATGATAQNTGRLVAGVAIAGAAAVGAGVLARRKTA